MGNDSAPKIIIFFTISLLFTSILTSWLLLNVYGVSVAGIPMELFTDAAISNSFDIKNGENVTGSYELGSGWEYQDGVGITSTSEDSYFLYNKQATANAAFYTNQYWLSNPNSEDYSIVIAKSVFGTQEISVEYDGYHLMQYGVTGELFGASELYFYPYTGANQNPSVNIKTEFCSQCLLNPSGEEDILKYYVDGSLMFSVPPTAVAAFGGQPDQMTPVYYGGVGSKNNVGLTIEKLSSSLTSEDSAGVDDLLAFCFTLMKLLSWGIEPEYLPYEINILLIKSQEFCILIGVIGMYWK